MKKLALILNRLMRGFMPSIKERYILLLACSLLIIPFARIVQEEYSNPFKKVDRVSKAQFKGVYTPLKEARLQRNSDAVIAELINLSQLYSKDDDSRYASTLLTDVLEDEVETTKQRVDILAALGDIYRDQKDEDGLRLAHRSYLNAIQEASKLDNKELMVRLQVKLLNLCYLKGSDDSAREVDRIAALREADKTIGAANKLADELNSKQWKTAIQNYSAMIALEEKRLGLSDKEKSW